MTRRRPGSVTTFAILNLVCGGLFLICGVVSMADSTLEVNGKDLTQEFKDHLDNEVPGYAVWRIGSLIGSMALAVGLIVSGIGLLLLQGWGRILALVVAGLAILHQLIQCVYQLAFVNPAAKRFLAVVPLGLGGFASEVRTMMLVAGALLVIAYSVVLLIMLLQAGTARAFRADYRGEMELQDDRPRRRRPERYEEDDDDSPRRSRRDEDDDYDDPPRRRRRLDEDDDY